GRRGPRLRRLGGGEGADEVAAERLELPLGAGVVAGRAAQLGGELYLAGTLEPARVLLVDRRADVAQEGEEAVARLAAQRLELVAEDGREVDGDRRAVEHLQDRQVHAGDGLEQPLLAERPSPEALHVGHVGVEDEREAPAGRHRRIARKSSALSRSPDRSLKSRALIDGVNQS